MPAARISTDKYTYIHEGGSSSMSAVDSHHVMLVKHGRRSFGLRATTLALLAAIYCISLLKHPWEVSWVWSIPSCFILREVLRGRVVVKESVVILPTLGMQLETHYKSGRIRRRFVPLGKILKPVLTECVTPVTCYWSLSLILREETELMLVFQELRPPLEMLVPIWRALCTSVDCK